MLGKEVFECARGEGSARSSSSRQCGWWWGKVPFPAERYLLDTRLLMGGTYHCQAFVFPDSNPSTKMTFRIGLPPPLISSKSLSI
jgi:hypothetical protein